MKHIDNGQERSIPYCRAFKEDIQQVIDLMTVDGVSPTLTSEDFEFANADELFTFLGERGKNSIRIRRDKPYVTVTAQTERVRVYTHDSSDASVALLHRVSEILDGCSANRWWRSSSVVVLAGGMLGGAFVSFGLHHSKEQWLAIGSLAGALALWGASIRLSIALTRKANRFYGIPRHSRKSFWQRKGDDLIVSLLSGAVGAVIGALLGVAGTLFVQAHTAPSPQNAGVQPSPTTSAARPNSG